MKIFGQRLRELRGALTQAEAAAALGITPSSYAMYEIDRREPNFQTLARIAEHYGVTTDYLLGLTNCKSPDIDMQAICKKTGLWPEAVKKLVAINNSDRSAIVGDDAEGLMDFEEIPQWQYKAFSLCINLFMLDDFAPVLAAKAYHAAKAFRKTQETNVEIIDKARTVVEEIDPELWVLAPRESQIFYRYLVDNYSSKIANHIIHGMEQYLEITEGRTSQQRFSWDEMLF